MKKINELIKNNIRLIIGISIGVFLSVPLAYAATIVYSANEIGYTNSGSQVSTIKGALDELYNRTKKWVNPNDMGTPTNYIYDGLNLPTTESPTTPPTCTTVYIGLYEDEQYGICIKKDGMQHCFRYNNWLVEKEHIKDAFPEVNCMYGYEQGKNIVRCYGKNFNCYVGADGSAYCLNVSKFEGATLNPDGNLNCISDC